MKRTPFSGRKRTDAEPTRPRSTEGGSRSRGALRKVALGLGVLGVAWALSRRRRSGDTEFSVDEVRERAEEAVPDAVTELAAGGLGGERSDARGEQGGGRTPAGAGDEAGTAGARSGETSYVDESMTDDEMEERVESDAHEEPAPPGEMNVDPDVAEEVVGGREGTEGDEGAADGEREQEQSEEHGDSGAR